VVTLEVNEITAGNLYKILGKLGGRVWVVAPEVSQLKVTLNLRNVPVQVAVETLNHYLNVRAADGHGRPRGQCLGHAR
jgi:hypothetical protein